MLIRTADAEILENTIASFGEEHQIAKAIEELSELQRALCRYLQTGAYAEIDNISEEMADVAIMMAQLYFIFDNTGHVEKWRREKMRRLEASIG